MNKLEYKDLFKDHKVKMDIQEKLVGLKEVEEVNLEIEVPKLFGGKKQAEVEAAIFLKNNREKSSQDPTDVALSQAEDEISNPKNRRAHYKDL